MTAVDWHQSKTANDGESQSKGCTPPVSFSPSYSVFWPEKVDELDPGSRASLRWTRALISERGGGFHPFSRTWSLEPLGDWTTGRRLPVFCDPLVAPKAPQKASKTPLQPHWHPGPCRTPRSGFWLVDEGCEGLESRQVGAPFFGCGRPVLMAAELSSRLQRPAMHAAAMLTKKLTLGAWLSTLKSRIGLHPEPSFGLVGVQIFAPLPEGGFG